jgi:hypothetical protein
MTANVIERAIGIAAPADVGTGAPPAWPAPEGPFATTVATLQAGFDQPSAVTELPDGSMAVAEPRRHRILRIGPAPAHEVSVLAGDGELSNNPAYDNVPGLQARFFSPTAVLADEGGLIVADTYNHAIRKILYDADRTVITLAGAMGQAGNVDGVGAEARFYLPMGLAIDPLTSDILVADSGNHRIRAIQRGSWAVSTLAGSAPGDVDGPAIAARFSHPTAVAVDAAGRIYAVASGNAKLIAIDRNVDGTVTTLAGGGRPGYLDGAGTVALLAPQAGLVWDGGALLVSEPTNYRIRRVIPGADAASTRVSTFAGSGRAGLIDGDGSEASLPLPLGLAIAAGGRVLVSDGANGAIRVITP